MKNYYETHWDIGKFTICFWTNFRHKVFALEYIKDNYYDRKGAICISLIFFTLCFRFPSYSSNDYDYISYGINISDSTFFLHAGKKTYSWGIPFFDKVFYKSYVLGKNGTWLDSTYREFYAPEHDLYMRKIGLLKGHKHPTDEESLAKTFYKKWNNSSGDEFDAKYRAELKIWRRKWLGWTKLFETRLRDIDIYIKVIYNSDDVTWKTKSISTTEPSFDGENPEETFARVMKRKDFE